MGERGARREGGKREWIGRLVIVPIRDPGEVWNIYDIKVPDAWLEYTGCHTANGFVAATETERQVNKFSYNLDEIIRANPQYSVDNSSNSDMTVVLEAPSRGEILQGGLARPLPEAGIFAGETNARGVFNNCQTLKDIEAIVAGPLFQDGKLKRETPKGENVSDLRSDLIPVKLCIENYGVLPAYFIPTLTNAEGFRDAVFRAVKSYFESQDSFDKCSSFDNIIERFEIVIAQNKIFASLPKFKIPQITLVNSGGESLFDFPRHPNTGQVLSTEDGLGLYCLKYLKYWKAQGYTAEQLKSTDAYQMITSKYGLRNAVDRALAQ